MPAPWRNPSSRQTPPACPFQESIAAPSCTPAKSFQRIVYFELVRVIRSTNSFWKRGRSKSICAWTRRTPIRRLQRLRPRERIAVARAVAQVHVHIHIHFFGDDRRIDPRARFELIPHIRAPLAPRGDVARRRRLRLRNRVQHLLREGRLDGDILGGHFNARPIWRRSTMCAASGSNQKLNSCRGSATSRSGSRYRLSAD